MRASRRVHQAVAETEDYITGRIGSPILPVR